MEKQETFRSAGAQVFNDFKIMGQMIKNIPQEWIYEGIDVTIPELN